MTNKRGDARRQHAAAGRLLGDILNAKLDHRAELQALRDWVRHALAPTTLRYTAGDDGPGALFGWRLRARIDYHAPRHHPTKRATP
jgi:hypothetical protein